MHRFARLAVVLLVGWMGAALVAAPAQAHPMPHSVVDLVVHDDAVVATLQVPAADLGVALGTDLLDTPDDVLTGQVGIVRDYLAQHLRVTTDDGRAWDVVVDEPTVSTTEQTATGPYREFLASATLTPPAGADTRTFVLADDAVVHQVVTHSIFVTVSRDWGAGRVDGAPSAVGVITASVEDGGVAPLRVDLGAASAWSGFAAMVRLGGAHILEGTDHLLFLLVLLLPAPLLAVGRGRCAGAGRRWRWGPAAPLRVTARRILGVTLAFTVGHSLTLVVSALGRFAIPERPVEALIAVSILVGAAHALRPLFPGREVVVAALFGLVHGRAFAFTLAELGLSTPQLLLSLVGFNLGIELMQVLVVGLVLPPLVLLARSGHHRPARLVGAIVAAIAAVSWLLARIGVPNAVADAADELVAAQGWIVVALWLLALGVRARGLVATGRRRRAAGSGGPDDVVPQDAAAEVEEALG